MAKKSMIAREVKRVKLSTKAKAKRSDLNAILDQADGNYEEKMLASQRLNKRKRNESPTRIRTRCRTCGRPRAVYKKFGLCRIHLREAAMRGDVPGLSKASW